MTRRLLALTLFHHALIHQQCSLCIDRTHTLACASGLRNGASIAPRLRAAEVHGSASMDSAPFSSPHERVSERETERGREEGRGLGREGERTGEREKERERGREEEEEEEEEEGLFKADAVNEEDPERDRATQV